MIRRVVGLLALIAGILLIVFGIVAGGAHFEGDQIGVDCGSAFSAKHFSSGVGEGSILTSAFDEEGCKPEMKAHKATVWTMIGWGIALTVLGAVAAAIPVGLTPIPGGASETKDGTAPAADTDSATSGVDSPSPVLGGTTDELERLASLHASGALDDDGFAQAKRRALGS